MTTACALPRILQVRQMEEDHLKATLETALARLARLVEAENAALERERRGRALLIEGIDSGQLQDRLAGWVEICTAQKSRGALSLKAEEAGEAVRQIRGRYLAKRAERRQLETLIETERTEKARQASRQQQQSLDDRYRMRRIPECETETSYASSFDRTSAGDKPDAFGE